MSEYGLVIRNDTNQIVIDSKYRNYSYSAHGTAVNVTKTIDHGEYIHTITTTSGIIVAAFRPVSDYSRLVGFQESGDTYTGLRFVSDANQSIPYIYYTEGLKNAIPDYGLVIYNDSGTIVWSSGEDGYFNIVEVQDWSVSVSANVTGDCDVKGEAFFTPTEYKDYTVVDVDNNYFFITGFQHAYSNCAPGNWSARYQIGVKKIDSTTIRFGWFLYDSQTYTGSGYQSGSLISSPQKLIEIKAPPSI